MKIKIGDIIYSIFNPEIPLEVVVFNDASVVAFSKDKKEIEGLSCTHQVLSYTQFSKSINGAKVLALKDEIENLKFIKEDYKTKLRCLRSTLNSTRSRIKELKDQILILETPVSGDLFEEKNTDNLPNSLEQSEPMQGSLI